ncbi:response regulator transcription factor [Dehalobacterium formicoaceticum]|uniref:Stage 0 sporulation protein A homolog n=1 Tax=Dehalobacterium formicoaceticum TaxID=51515 RepID=A0ABT1Y368_9FIRM|nr:response regulator transcription factor [Dehalobacterium formicoaceticum]MCR6545309.1 response regulator transcription factor [Dehalobacterium formicoaceticum]
MMVLSEKASSRQGLTAIFAQEDTFEMVGTFAIEEGLRRAIPIQPDVVLLDIEEQITPQQLEQLDKLSEACPCSMILSIVSEEQNEIISSLLAHGIDGCIPRGMMRGSLVKTIELVCRCGVLCLPGSIKSKVALNGFAPSAAGNISKKFVLDGNEVLTKREYEVLQLMAENLSNRQISETLFIGEATVKTHVSNILRKLKQNNRAQAVVYSYQAGLISALILFHGSLSAILKSFF